MDEEIRIQIAQTFKNYRKANSGWNETSKRFLIEKMKCYLDHLKEEKQITPSEWLRANMRLSWWNPFCDTTEDYL